MIFLGTFYQSKILFHSIFVCDDGLLTLLYHQILQKTLYYKTLMNNHNFKNVRHDFLFMFFAVVDC